MQAAGFEHHSHISHAASGEILPVLPYYGEYLQRHVGFGTGKPEDPPEKRFGIGSLINRMAGHAEAPAERPAARPQPPVQAYDDEQDQQGENDRIEIPAFLRRQAN